MPGIRMSATRQATVARLALPRKLSASSYAAVENPAALSKFCVALRIDLSSSTMATSGPSAISPRAIETRAYPTERRQPIARKSPKITPWYNPLGGVGRTQSVSHAHQLRDRLRQHLAHDLPTMDFHGHHAQSERGRDLFVDASGNDELHHFLLARSERVVTRLQCREACGLLAPCPIALDRRM